MDDSSPGSKLALVSWASTLSTAGSELSIISTSSSSVSSLLSCPPSLGTLPSQTRFAGHQNGPLNYFGIINFCAFASILIQQTGIHNYRHQIFNNQDKATFYTKMINMSFPPSFLNNRISAHYIEINQIVMYEMSKKWKARKAEIAEERNSLPDHIKKTKYATNPNYVYPKQIN